MKLQNKNYAAVSQAIFAAALFGMSAPFSKLLLTKLSPLFLSALLYLGAGLGMLAIDNFKRLIKIERVEARLTKNELPYVILMVLLDVLAPISLMFGLEMTSAANAALLNNFEIVATAIIALIIFREAIANRLWLSIMLITLSSIILSVADWSSFTFSLGSIFILLACISWGFENNCTRKLSIKDPLQVVIIKGFGAGIVALAIAIFYKSIQLDIIYIVLSLVLGFFAYGMSIFFYVRAQRNLGAARTSAYYAIAPFIGVLISYIIFKESITIKFVIAFIIMLAGTYLAVAEKHVHKHMHQSIEHEHRHDHSDGHHNHTHKENVIGEHSHLHKHEEIAHTHEHTPDLHHSHQH